MDLVDRVAYRLKLRDLRLLDTVVRWGSMAKAANQLNLSQPAVSKAIAEMEQVLGVRLIDRGRQGVEPTPHGLALLKRGIAIYDELRQGVAEIEHLSDPTAGEVRIAAPEPIAAGLLTVLIAQFTRKYPRASVYVTQTPVASLQVLDAALSRRARAQRRSAAGADLRTHHGRRSRERTAVRGPRCRRRRDRQSLGAPAQRHASPTWSTSLGCSSPPTPSRAGVTSRRFAQRDSVCREEDHVRFGAGPDRPGGDPTLLHDPSRTRCCISAPAGSRSRRLPIKLKIEPFTVGIVTLKKRTISPAAQAVHPDGARDHQAAAAAVVELSSA